MKRCPSCDDSKPLDGFHRDKSSRDGRCTTCKACANARARRWRAENLERAKAGDRAYYLSHREEVGARAKAHYADNRESRKASIADWQRRNPEKVLAYGRAHHAKDPEYQRARSRRYYEANKHRWLDYSAQRRVREGSASPEVQSRIAELRTQSCAYCDSTQQIEIDHIVPLARGGTHTPENLAPACRSCNRSKGAFLLEEWMGVAA